MKNIELRESSRSRHPRLVCQGGALFALLGILLLNPAAAFASDGRGDHERLHFTHPLIAESPSPDTKLRFDYEHDNGTSEERAERDTLRLEAEYAFARWISLEASVPYTFLDPEDESARSDFGNSEVALKLAWFKFEEVGLLLGGGLEVGLPTGNSDKEIGSDEGYEIEPYLDFGYMRRAFEMVGFLSFGFPVDADHHHDADVEIGWNLSFLVHATPWARLLLEFDGESVRGGEEDGTSIVNITPGIKFQPFAETDFEIGAGVSLPLTDDREFDARPLVSLFYHF